MNPQAICAQQGCGVSVHATKILIVRQVGLENCETVGRDQKSRPCNFNVAKDYSRTLHLWIQERC